MEQTNEINKAFDEVIDIINKVDIKAAISLLETSAKVASSYLKTYENEISNLANLSRPYVIDFMKLYRDFVVNVVVLGEKIEKNETIVLAVDKILPGKTFKLKHAYDLLSIQNLFKRVFPQPERKMEAETEEE